MKVIDLFSGIGGFSLGLESTGGFETVQFVENNKWCQKVLAKNFPNVPITGDIKNYEPKRSERIGLVCGGFPCQPFSVAGKRKGTEDDRHLWPEMLRVIKASKPRWVIGENVRNFTSIQEGMVFEQVCTDLENEGYEVQSFVIPASAVNAPHQRYRVWIVGYSKHNGSQDRCKETRGEKRESEQGRMLESERTSTQQNVANSENRGREQTEWKKGQGFERGSYDSGGTETERQEVVRDVANTQCDGLTSTKKRRSTKETIRQESQGENRTLDSQGASGLSEAASSVADSKRMGCSERTEKPRESENEEPPDKFDNSSQGCSVRKPSKDVADSEKQGLEGYGESCGEKLREEHSATERSEEQQRGMDHERFSVEPRVGRVAHGVSNRVDRIKGLGNAIVPQIAYQIGLAILEAEKSNES